MDILKLSLLRREQRIAEEKKHAGDEAKARERNRCLVEIPAEWRKNIERRSKDSDTCGYEYERVEGCREYLDRMIVDFKDDGFFFIEDSCYFELNISPMQYIHD